MSNRAPPALLTLLGRSESPLGGDLIAFELLRKAGTCGRFSQAAPRNSPGTVRRAPTCARTVLLRAEIIRRSSSASIAMIPTVRRLAFVMSAQEFHAGLFQPKEEVGVSAEAIELRNHQCGPVDAAGLGGADRLESIGTFAALHLGELVHELTGAIGEDASDHLALHVEPMAERALAGGAYVVVGDQGTGRDGRITPQSTDVDKDVSADRAPSCRRNPWFVREQKVYAAFEDVRDPRACVCVGGSTKRSPGYGALFRELCDKSILTPNT